MYHYFFNSYLVYDQFVAWGFDNFTLFRPSCMDRTNIPHAWYYYYSTKNHSFEGGKS